MLTTEDDGISVEQRLRQRAVHRTDPLSTTPSDPGLKPRGLIPNTPAAVATVAFLLGIAFALGGTMIAWALWSGRPTYRLGFYIAAWAGFHYGEFVVTAGWNREKCSIDSYLLENGIQYHIAHCVAVLEYVLASYFLASYREYPYVTSIGVVLVILGQYVRSAAMIHAGSSFSHTVAFCKLDDHVLVTDGIYSWFRHPSYAGFFYWALGTQLVLQNPISSIGFVVVLWKFFSNRIKHEEVALVRFFGDDYKTYRSKTGTMIPFI